MFMIYEVKSLIYTSKCNYCNWVCFLLIEELVTPAIGTVTTTPSGIGVVTGGQCESGQIACVNGECVSVAALCNGKPDCADHSDELQCGKFNVCLQYY